MKYLRVELQDVVINEFSRGSVIEILKDTAYRLIEQGYVTAVNEDTPIKIVLTADNRKQVLNVKTNTVKAT